MINAKLVVEGKRPENHLFASKNFQISFVLAPSEKCAPGEIKISPMNTQNT